ncbi:hypothetical protein [Streptomyces sp. NPDC058279]|uniref:hypothetical protein n=1 Tax=Streptomyces sp. NPDC058279 TaxID=3346418 RepID=UPI0036E68250
MITSTAKQLPAGRAAPSAAEVFHARYASRLPASLEKLVGPRHRVVELPVQTS